MKQVDENQKAILQKIYMGEKLTPEEKRIQGKIPLNVITQIIQQRDQKPPAPKPAAPVPGFASGKNAEKAETADNFSQVSSATDKASLDKLLSAYLDATPEQRMRMKNPEELRAEYTASQKPPSNMPPSPATKAPGVGPTVAPAAAASTPAPSLFAGVPKGGSAPASNMPPSPATKAPGVGPGPAPAMAPTLKVDTSLTPQQQAAQGKLNAWLGGDKSVGNPNTLQAAQTLSAAPIASNPSMSAGPSPASLFAGVPKGGSNMPPSPATQLGGTGPTPAPVPVVAPKPAPAPAPAPKPAPVPEPTPPAGPIPDTKSYPDELTLTDGFKAVDTTIAKSSGQVAPEFTDVPAGVEEIAEKRGVPIGDLIQLVGDVLDVAGVAASAKGGVTRKTRAQQNFEKEMEKQLQNNLAEAETKKQEAINESNVANQIKTLEAEYAAKAAAEIESRGGTASDFEKVVIRAKAEAEFNNLIASLSPVAAQQIEIINAQKDADVLAYLKQHGGNALEVQRVLQEQGLRLGSYFDIMTEISKRQGTYAMDAGLAVLGIVPSALKAVVK